MNSDMISRLPLYQRTAEPVWGRSGYDFNRSPPPLQGAIVPPYSTAVIHSTVKAPTESDIYRVGVYGWRKRCLYCFICALTVAVVLNLALTVWIISVLDISTTGMGTMRIEDDSIRIMGEAQFDRPVHFTELSTADNEALTIDSYRGVFIKARNISGYQTAMLNMFQDGRMEAVCDRFEIYDNARKLLFFAESNEIGLKLENLRILARISDEGGSVFEGAIQTALIRPESDSPLSLESPTRNLNLEAGQDIEVTSAAGEIQLSSLLDITINSKQGEIRLESSSIVMPSLPKTDARGNAQYQLCICQNGLLFMAVVGADCRADRGVCS
uniref:Sarcoglycan complex subunit protein n=1 Tax=Elaeophora elaphi TaxID=1147741 RepID=A0A0R3S0G9_9BILA